MLAGEAGDVRRVYPMTNIDPGDVTYLIEPAGQFKAVRQMREEGLELVGIFHSHPASPAYPSLTDIRLAFYPGVAYVIVSFVKTSEPELKAFQIIDGSVSERSIEIKEEKNGNKGNHKRSRRNA